MSARYGSPTGVNTHYGNTGLGVLGAVIRANTATGDAGPGCLYNDWQSSADDSVEMQGLIVTPPSVGTFFAFEDGSFTLIGAPDGVSTFVYRLIADGVDKGAATATVQSGQIVVIAPPLVVSNSVRNLRFAELLRGVT